MSKRLTDSEKWRDPWFSELSQEDKLLWLYLLDACDHAGVWKVNVRFLNFSLESAYTIDTIMKALGSRVHFISSEYLLIEKYLQFQYPKGLSDKNKPQKAAMDILLKHNVLDRVIKGYDKGYHTPQDKDTDKDTDKELGLDTPLKKKAKKKAKKAFVPPTREEFIQHAVETLPRRNPDWSPEQAFRCADQQFDTYVDQDWHDGNGKKIANWKNKSITAMLYRKPHYFGSNPQFFLEQKKIAANSASPL